MRISRDRMAEWEPTARQDRLSSLIPERDYRGMSWEESQLRVWLPEPARIGLEEVSERMEVSMTVYLIEYFTSYLYGQHELLRMRESRLGLYAPPEVRYCKMGGPAEPPLPKLGKNIFALKLFVPTRLKDDLQALASRAEITLGELSRGLICAHLFGRDYGPRKLVDWTDSDEQMAREWEAAA